MAEMNLRSDAVDVEQIMRQIRARIREKRGADYTEAELQQLAAVRLEKFLDPKGVRSDLVEQFKRHRVVSPAPPNFEFDVDHYQAGGLRDYDIGRPALRPFLTGTLGLTRYATQGQNELRFTLGAGGGIKMFPSRHVGLRLDGRAFMTFVDANVSLFACSTLGFNQGCVIGFQANIVWQA